MLTAQVLSQAAAVEKEIYRALTELEELTQELEQAVSRGDKVSVQMFLSMRRDSLNQMARHQASLHRQYTTLPAADARMLRSLLEDPSPPACTGSEDLVRQAERNRTILQRIVRTDRKISQRLAGNASFYTKHP